MIETDLSMKDFTRYFEKNRLGMLWFPNGNCFTPNGSCFEHGKVTPFHIDLKTLYKLAIGWEINSTKVPLDDVVGVIAFGSAVKHPGYQKVPETKRKYLIFGPRIPTG